MFGLRYLIVENFSLPPVGPGMDLIGGGVCAEIPEEVVCNHIWKLNTAICGTALGTPSDSNRKQV